MEEIAKKSGLTENEVARAAIVLAEQGAAGTNSDSRAGHVGFYLIDGGLPQLKTRVPGSSRPSPTWCEASVAGFLCRSTWARFFSLALIFTAGVLAETGSHGMHGPLLWIVGVLSLLSVSSLAIALVNLFATRLVTPRPLPTNGLLQGDSS